MLDRLRLKEAFGIEDVAALEDLYVSIHREAPSDATRRRFSAVLRQP